MLQSQQVETHMVETHTVRSEKVCPTETDAAASALTTVSPREEYAVPENFSMVVPGIFRSSFPHAENFAYLRLLGLKSVLVLVPEPYPTENAEFLRDNKIRLFQVGMSGNKEPFVNVADDLITTALVIAMNPENQPILIHCNRGKHRTGCVVGCMRKLQDWSLTMIFDEYRRHAHPKIRPLDQQFIELYDEREIYLIGRVYGWIPIAWRPTADKAGVRSGGHGVGVGSSSSASYQRTISASYNDAAVIATAENHNHEDQNEDGHDYEYNHNENDIDTRILKRMAAPPSAPTVPVPSSATYPRSGQPSQASSTRKKLFKASNERYATFTA
ncbi:tyrosine phosphatase family-domain-containing protein [Limtongia smithiae]|uniref:tyrosine phosphatase family-domain-containing protein n=1 Tax=Limtongia smithiae TaxID=1125753 RepID=UPI0034CFA2A6